MVEESRNHECNITRHFSVLVNFSINISIVRSNLKSLKGSCSQKHMA